MHVRNLEQCLAHNKVFFLIMIAIDASAIAIVTIWTCFYAGNFINHDYTFMIFSSPLDCKAH